MATETSSRAKPSGILTLLWALFFFFIFALLMTLWVRCSGTPVVATDDRVARRIAKREELDKADAERLQNAGVVDQAKGIAHLPIAEAKKLMIAELKNKSVTASQLKVEPPLPMPAPPDPNSTEPPPMALPSAPQGADTFRFQQPGEAGVQGEVAPPAAEATAPAQAPATPAPTEPTVPAAPAQPTTPGQTPVPANPASSPASSPAPEQSAAALQPQPGTTEPAAPSGEPTHQPPITPTEPSSLPQ